MRFPDDNRVPVGFRVCIEDDPEALLVGDGRLIPEHLARREIVTLVADACILQALDPLAERDVAGWTLARGHVGAPGSVWGDDWETPGSPSLARRAAG